MKFLPILVIVLSSVFLLFFLTLGIVLLLREIFHYDKLQQKQLSGNIPARISLFFGLASVLGVLLSIFSLIIASGWEPPWIMKTPEVKYLDVNPSILAVKQLAKARAAGWDAKGRLIRCVWKATGGIIKETGSCTADYRAPDREGNYFVMVMVACNSDFSKEVRHPVTVSIDEDNVAQAKENYSKALSAFEVDNYSKSISELSNSLNAVPNFYEALVLRGAAFEKEGNHWKALSDYETAVELTPDYEPAYLLRANAHMLLGDRKKAESDISRVLNFTDNPEYYKILADFERLPNDEDRLARLRSAILATPIFRDPFVVLK